MIGVVLDPSDIEWSGDHSLIPLLRRRFRAAANRTGADLGGRRGGLIGGFPDRAPNEDAKTLLAFYNPTYIIGEPGFRR